MRAGSQLRRCDFCKRVIKSEREERVIEYADGTGELLCRSCYESRVEARW